MIHAHDVYAFKYRTREQWLNAFIVACKPHFEEVTGHALPANIRVSIGFPSSGAKSKMIGECWSSCVTADDTFEIFITPTIDDPLRVADILVHELVHAAVGIDAKHGPRFKKAARALKLEGKLTATIGGEEFAEWASPIVDTLGAFPASAMTLTKGSAKKPQKNRWLKLECPDCGTITRTSRKALTLICEAFEGSGVEPHGRCLNPKCDGLIPLPLDGTEDGDSDEGEGD